MHTRSTPSTRTLVKVRHLILTATVLLALATLTACGEPDGGVASSLGGQTGGEIQTEDVEPEIFQDCQESAIEITSDAPSPLGFSFDQAFARLVTDTTLAPTWYPAEPPVGYDTDAPDSELRVSVLPDTALGLFVESAPSDDASDAEQNGEDATLRCRSRIEWPASFSFVSAGGALNETRPGHLVVYDESHASAELSLRAGELEGSLAPSVAGADSVMVVIEVSLSELSLDGSLELSWEENVDGRPTDSRHTVVEW